MGCSHFFRVQRMPIIIILCSGWLYPQDDALGYVARIDQRLEDVTGLTVTTAEPLQVLNYGIAGQYQPHFDFNPVCKIYWGQSLCRCVGHILHVATRFAAL